jgi:hypothetical protein
MVAVIRIAHVSRVARAMPASRTSTRQALWTVGVVTTPYTVVVTLAMARRTRNHATECHTTPTRAGLPFSK